MKYSATLIFLFIFGSCFGQIYLRGYAPSYSPKAVTTDSHGNSYICGSYDFGGNHDFDPNPNKSQTLSNTGGMFVQKFNKCGHLIWVKSFGEHSSGSADATSIKIDPTGAILIGGHFAVSADFNPGLSTIRLINTTGGQNIFVLKLDSNGDYLWAKQFFPNNSSNTLNGMSIDNSGNLYGITYLSGSGSSSHPLSNVFFKIDPSGGLLWSHNFPINLGNINTSYLTGLGVDPTGNPVICGFYYDTLRLKTLGGSIVDSAISKGSRDIFYAKYNSNGQPIWLISYGDIDPYDTPAELSIDNLGNIYSVGNFQKTIDFDPGPSTNNLTASGIDSYILKLSPTGSLVWAKSFGGTQVCWVYQTALGSNDDLTINGHFTDSIDFDPGPGIAMANGGGGFSSKFDKNGNFKSHKVIQNINGFVDTHVDSRDHLYEIGQISLGVDSIDLIPGPIDYWVTSKPQHSNVSGYFVSIFSDTSECEVISIDENFTQKFSVYPNPSSKSFFVNRDNTLEAKHILIEVYSIHGKQVYKSSTLDSTFELDFEGKTGVYILNLKSENQKASYRLFKL